MKAIFTGLAALLLLTGLGYYHWVYPPNRLKRETGNALLAFADTVESQDKEKITISLQDLLAENAKIRLEVSLFALNAQNRPLMERDFDKAAFIQFADSMLNRFNNYIFNPELTHFTLAEDERSADIGFSVKQWADGTSYYGGIAVESRFTLEGSCEGRVLFVDDLPKLIQNNCNLRMGSVPKPDELNKIRQNPGAVRDLLLEP